MARFYRRNPPLTKLEDGTEMVTGINGTGIEIGFYHSECGKDWNPTGNPASPLTGKRPLCCIKHEDSGKFKFLQVPCNQPKKFKLTCYPFFRYL